MNIGILGGGQLGRMLALAGYRLGFNFRLYDPSPEAPGFQVADHVSADWEDRAALDRFREGLDLVTYEFESVPASAARHLAAHLAVYPPPEALEASQDRLHEKSLFERLEIPTAPFCAVDHEADLTHVVDRIGLPFVLKTRRSGYDGKGQRVVRHREDAVRAFRDLGGRPSIAEAFVPFQRELSIIAVRGRAGEVAFYPLVENRHAEGILRRTVAPAPQVSSALQRTAEDHARRFMSAVGYVGVLAIEFFEHEGRLLANETAPRVHNSGHWTIEGAVTSQFENHLRAVAGLPLGNTAPIGRSTMYNVIGRFPPIERILAVPGAHVHDYAKRPARGRKLGHVTWHERSFDAANAAGSPVLDALFAEYEKDSSDAQ